MASDPLIAPLADGEAQHLRGGEDALMGLGGHAPVRLTMNQGALVGFLPSDDGMRRVLKTFTPRSAPPGLVLATRPVGDRQVKG